MRMTQRLWCVVFFACAHLAFLANVLRYVGYMLSAFRLSSVVCRLSVCL